MQLEGIRTELCLKDHYVLESSKRTINPKFVRFRYSTEILHADLKLQSNSEET